MDRRDALVAAERHFAGEDVQFDPNVYEVLGGEYAVHGQQQYRGLSIYPHSTVVRVAADGQTTAEGNPLVDAGEVDIVPRIGPEAAARAAFLHVRDGSGEWCHTPHEPASLRGYRPRVVVAFPMPNRPTVLSPGPFDEPVQANLVLHRDTVRLAWLVCLYLEGVADYTIVVAASGDDAGAVLSCAVEAASAVCSADVYLFNPDEAPRVQTTFPRPPADYPLGIRPASAFRDWVESNRAFGNNVETLFKNQNPKIRLTSGGPAGKQFVTSVNSADEQVVNAFYLCNFAHDLFSLIGFDEAHGNFQNKNFSGQGKGSDRLIVSIVESAQGEANVRGQNDGRPVELTLGRWNGSTGKPTALDADIVLHEFAHAVSQRLVGGPQKKGALVEPQSLALGEAWSDYFAITIQNFYRATPRFTFGAFVSQRPNGVRPTETNPVPYNHSPRTSACSARRRSPSSTSPALCSRQRFSGCRKSCARCSEMRPATRPAGA